MIGLSARPSSSPKLGYIKRDGEASRRQDDLTAASGPKQTSRNGVRVSGFMECGRSDRLDICRFNYLGPFRDVAGNELAEFAGRRCIGSQPEIIKPRPDVWLG